MKNYDPVAVMLQCCESMRELIKLIRPPSEFDDSDTSWSVLKPIKFEEGPDK